MLPTLSKKDTIVQIILSQTEESDQVDINLSYLFYKQAEYIFPQEPTLQFKLAVCNFKQKNYRKALMHAEKWFELGHKEQNSTYRTYMFYVKGYCLLQLGKYELVAENLKKAINGFLQAKDNEKAAEAKKILEEELPRLKENPYQKPAVLKREECIKVKKYFDLNELPDVPGKMVYILPADWIQRWREYNDYYEFMGENDKRKDFMDEEKDKIKWLGPIDPSKILVDEMQLVDPRKEELYANYQLKPDLEENKDFFIVSEEFWEYLFKIYGGIPIQRPTYRKSEDQMSISIETWLQKINVMILPIPKTTQPAELKKTDTIYISKKKTVKDLIDKLIEVYSPFFRPYNFRNNRNRIWKVDPRFELGFAWRKWNGERSFEIQGSILDEGVLIEEAEISNEDTLIFETHYLSKDWFLSDDVLSKNQKEEIVSISLDSIKNFPQHSKKGLTGLQNLGNTCFMNSAIQCLSNTFDLTTYFLTNEYKKDINKFNALGSGGKLAYYYCELMKEMWLGSSSSVSPWDLKKTIGKLASQFVGFGQQDSQELLSYLLDGLHEDLNRVKEKPFIEIKDDDNRPDEIVAEESWKNHLKRNQSKIQELMHGQLKSRLDCPDCKKVSITFDPYMTLSLPIPTVEYVKFFLYFVYDDCEKIPVKITLNMPSNTTYPEILTKLSKLVKVSKKTIAMGLLKEHKLIEFVDNSVDVMYLKDHEGILFAYEIPSTSFGTQRKTDGNMSDAMSESSNSSTVRINGNSDATSNGTYDPDSTADTNKMEAESGGINSYICDSLIRVYIQADPKAFYESEKTISYTRLIKFDPSDTYKDLHLKVYERMRNHLYKYFDKLNMKNPIKLEDKSKMTIEKEYSVLFPEDNEGQWLYKIWMVNTSKEDVKTGKKIPCELCQKAKCARCLLPNEEGRVSNYIQKMRVLPKEMLLELKIASKIVKLDALPLNQCKEFKSDNDDDSNPNRNYNIYDCINLFTRKEKLEKDNAWYCSKCKAHKEAQKKMEIYNVPPILIIHLKRFKTSRPTSIGPFYWNQGKKINATINFPVNGLDLSEYVLGDSKKEAMYDLYAVSNHFGGLSGGHYTAYAKNPLNGQWYDFNDSRVSSISEKEVVGPAAYVLFYRRREKKSE